MSPLKVNRTHRSFAGRRLSPTDHFGSNTWWVSIAQGLNLSFMNSLKLETWSYEGFVQVKDGEGNILNEYPLNVGDKLVVEKVGSPWVYVVEGVENNKGRRK